MKKEEFEWLKKWIHSILVDTALDPDQKLPRERIIEFATNRYPPPIDKEKLPFATTLHCHKHHTNFELNENCPECEEEEKDRKSGCNHHKSLSISCKKCGKTVETEDERLWVVFKALLDNKEGEGPFVPDPFKNPACLGCGISHTGRMKRCKACTFWEEHWKSQGYEIIDGRYHRKSEKMTEVTIELELLKEYEKVIKGNEALVLALYQTIAFAGLGKTPQELKKELKEIRKQLALFKPPEQHQKTE